MEMILPRPRQELYNFMWLSAAVSEVCRRAIAYNDAQPMQEFNTLSEAARLEDMPLAVLLPRISTSKTMAMDKIVSIAIQYLFSELGESVRVLSWQYGFSTDQLQHALHKTASQLSMVNVGTLYGQTKFMLTLSRYVSDLSEALMSQVDIYDPDTWYILARKVYGHYEYYTGLEQVAESAGMSKVITWTSENIDDADFFLNYDAAETTNTVIKTTSRDYQETGVAERDFQVTEVDGWSLTSIDSFDIYYPKESLVSSECKLSCLTSGSAWDEILHMTYVQMYRVTELVQEQGAGNTGVSNANKPNNVGDDDKGSTNTLIRMSL